MSKVKIQGNASGTGVVTLTAPNTNTDRTITLPDSSDTLVSTAPSTSGNILTSDGTNWTSAAPAAAGADTSLSNLSATGENKVCQAWVSWNGTGTISICTTRRCVFRRDDSISNSFIFRFRVVILFVVHNVSTHFKNNI